MPTNNSWNSQDPAQVAKGGTGIATTTAYAPICGGTTATGALQAASTGLSTSGYVLTSNGASALPSFQSPGVPTCLFRAYKSSSTQVVSGGNEDLVVYDGISFQVGTAYDSGTSTFTCPVTGYYFVNIYSLLSVGGTGDSFIVKVNGSVVAYIAGYPVAGSQEYGGSVLLSLSATNTVTIYYYCSSGSATIQNGTPSTWFEIFQVQAGGGAGSLVWNEITAASANLAANNGYIANRGSLVTLTLPTTAAVGSIIEVVGKGSGGWKIAQNANQMIHINASTSTTGATGYLSSNDRYNSVKLLCTVADLEFTVLSSEGTLNLN